MSIGSSDVAAILGMGFLEGAPSWLRDKGPWKVYAREVYGLEEERDDGAMRIGRVFEDGVRQLFALDHPYLEVEPGIEYPDPPLQGPEPWMRDRPDGYVLHKGERMAALEVKTTGSWGGHWGETRTNQVPPWYAVQCIWHMLHTNLDACALPCLALLPRQVRYFELQRDMALEERVVNEVGDWYHRHIEREQYPEVDASKGCSEVLRDLWVPAGREYHIPTEEELGWASELGAIKAKMKELDTEKRLLENRLKERIGEADGLRGVALFTPTKPRQTLDKKRLLAEIPDADRFFKTGKPGRTFRFIYEGE